MKVSIITACFNSEKTIFKTIKSVNTQSYENIEHIFIDGLSTDNTVKIIEQNSTRLDTLISEQDNGLYDAMNKGIKLAKGDIIGILNSDDIYPSNNILTDVVNTMLQNNYDILYGNINYVDKNGKIVRKWNSSPYKEGSFRTGWHPPHPSLFVKKRIYNECGFFNTDLNTASDFEFMLRIFENSDYNKIYLNQTIVSMLTGGKSNTIKGIIEGQKEIKLAFKYHNINLPQFYFIRRYLNKLKEYISWLR